LISIRPDFYYNSVLEIPYEELFATGIRGLIFDIDNTLTAFDAKLPPQEVSDLIEYLLQMGFKICLLTNNTTKRLNGFNSELKLPGIANAVKPMKRGIIKAMKLIDTDAASSVMIGDQLLSDVWAGRNAGVKTIMVKPTTERDFFFVKFKRLIERIMLRKFFQEKSQGGFTLIELLIVLAIMSIVLGAGLAVFRTGSNERRDLESASRMLQADLRYAQRRALTEGRRIGIQFFEEGGYDVVIIDTAEVLRTVHFNDITVTRNRQESRLHYTVRGTPFPAMTITLASDNYTRALIINPAGGRVRLEDIKPQGGNNGE